MKKHISTLTFCTIAILFNVRNLCAQPEAAWHEKLITYIESRFSEENIPDTEQLFEDLRAIAGNPININSAGFSDLSKLYFLSPVQVQNLINYRESFGAIVSPFEMKAIDGFDEELIRLIGYFVIFNEDELNMSAYPPRQELLVRGVQLLEKQKGYKEPAKYEGSRLKFYSQYRLSSKNIQAGITAEKDAGETFFKHPNKAGFDYYSAFINILSPKKEHQLFIGDYRLQFGQGLAVWQGFSMGKSVDISSCAKFNQGIKPYTSTDENNFMRGIAAKLRVGNFSIFPFFSSKNFDANTEEQDKHLIFTSFQTSGLHRTHSEIEDKNSVQEQNFGTHMVYTGRFYSIGATGICSKYGLPLKRKEANYNRYLFNGKMISNYSVDYKIGLNNYFLFGEFAGCSTNGYALLGGLLSKPFDKIEFSAIFRDIDKKYNAPKGNAFIENSKLNDEQGIYIGLKILPLPKISVQGYVDFFKYRWVKYTTTAPGNGSEFQVQLNWHVSPKWNLYTRYFYEIKPVKTSIGSVKMNFDQHREKLRFHLDGHLSNNFFIRSRVEFSFYSHDHKSDGFLVFQDFGFTSEKRGVKCWFRSSYFNINDYDSRIYTYENDMLYQFSVPGFYGEGIRSYLNGKVKICKKTELWFKASRSWFFNAESVGSGYAQIEGNKRTEMKIQLRFRF